MITLTAAEARRLFNLSTRITRDPEHHQHWSDWRRAHQARARRFHYNRRLSNNKLML
jgi:hypothetical protein